MKKQRLSIRVFLKPAVLALCGVFASPGCVEAVESAGFSPQTEAPVANTASQSPAQPASSPRSASLQDQYGPSRMGHGSAEDHLINLLAVNSYGNVAGRTQGGQPIRLAEMIEQGHFDPNTKTWLSLPNRKPIELGFIRGQAARYPEYYSGRYVATWEGDGDLAFRLGEPSSVRRVGKNRIELTFSPDRARWTLVQITRIGKAGVRNVRVFRAEDEAALKNGAIFSTRFRDLVSKYDIVRTMDMNGANNSWVRNVDQIAKIDDVSFGFHPSEFYPTDFARGLPLSANVKLATETGAALWLNVPHMLGAPDVFDQEDYFREITVPQAGGGRRGVLRERVAQHAGDIFASNELDRYADALVQSLIEQDYPADRMLYLELANEIWNYAPGFAKTASFFFGMSDALREGRGREVNARYAYGFLSARLAHAFEDALTRAGRDQEWTLVLGVQTAVAGPTRRIIDGVENYYQTERGGGPSAQQLQRFGLATTSYFGGGFKWNRNGNMYNAPTRETWMRRFLADLEEDPEALRNRIERWILNEQPIPYNRAWMLKQKSEHRQIARDRGVRYLGDYEGGDHDTLEPALNSNKAALDFYNEFRTSPQAARIRASVDSAIAARFPGTINSDFGRIYAFDPSKPRPPWMEHMWNEETPLKQEVERRVVGGR